MDPRGEANGNLARSSFTVNVRDGGCSSESGITGIAIR
jgi:hypothetical protein